MNDNCVFCKLAAGLIPTATVYEDEDFRAILDVAPAHRGHTILIPKQHATDIFELSDDVAGKALPIAKKIAAAIKKETNCDGINILQNNGEAAGQSVFHLHIHIIPRFTGDGLLPVWKQGAYDNGEAPILADRIHSKM